MKRQPLKSILAAMFLMLLPVTVGAQIEPVVRRTQTTTTNTTPTTTTTTTQDRPVSRRVTTGTLKITSTPADVAVKIDGEYMGNTPLTLRNRPAGRCTVTFNAEGYETQTKTVTVTAGQTTTCNATMKRKQTPSQPTVTPTPQPVTPTPQPADNNSRAAVETITVNGVSFKMVRVEGGTFTMGATAEQGSYAYDSEKPSHRVTLSTFSIGETEVTQQLWEAVMGSNPSNFKGAQRPVEQVSWEDCQGFIRELNRLTQRQFRLPTEAEWEFAARGGNKSTGCKYAGSHSISNVAWYTDNSGSTTHDVKTKQANELGLYDMSGNVWEWCQDWYGSYSSAAATNPTGPSSGSYRVIRGGGWLGNAKLCRVSDRSNSTPSHRNNFLGLRLAL